MNQSKFKIRYDFWKGHPNDDELPVDDLKALLQQSIQHDDESLLLRTSLQYGQSCGNPILITELKLFLQRQCALDIGNNNNNKKDDSDTTCSRTSIFITEGVSHGVDLLTTVATTQPGDYVLTEHPTYFLIAEIFHSHQLKVGILPIVVLPPPQRNVNDENDNGSDEQNSGRIDFVALEHGLRTGDIPIPRLIYIIPSHHNPTGRCMSYSDRETLTRLAHQYQILVIADEVYHLLDWSNNNNHTDNNNNPQQQQHRLARMVTWNSTMKKHHFQESNDTVVNNDTTTSSLLYGCVSVSSFTKIFGPGVRCGWIEATDPRIIQAIQNIGYIQSQGGVAPVMGMILSLGLSTRTIDRVVQRLRDQYQRRCNVLCDILQRESMTTQLLHLTCRPTGGYFVWIQFPFIMNLQVANDFLEYCIERGVRFMPGTRCDARPMMNQIQNNDDTIQRQHNNTNDTIGKDDNYHCLHSYARLCFAKMNIHDIEQGAELFIQCLQSYINEERMTR